MERKILPASFGYSGTAQTLCYNRARRKVKALLEAKQNATNEEQLPVNDIPVVRLKDEKGHFKKEAIACVMTLGGECEVPADRCGAIIRSVVHQK